MIPYFWQVLFMSVYFMPVKRNWIHCLKQELFLSLIISFPGGPKSQILETIC